jgi:hypothetical protein
MTLIPSAPSFGLLRFVRNDEPQLERDCFRLNRYRALDLWWSMIFSENRPPPIGSTPEGMLFRIML